jgi:hypothetical protein
MWMKVPYNSSKNIFLCEKKTFVQRLRVLTIFKKANKPKPSIEGGSRGFKVSKKFGVLASLERA